MIQYICTFFIFKNNIQGATMQNKEKMNILIIEDDKAIRECVRILLEGEGLRVIEAINGKEGIEQMTPDIHLVILDIMMPGISGIQVCETIRQF